MEHNLIPKSGLITQIKEQSQFTKLFTIKLADYKEREDFNFKPGQFIQISIPGFGEAPFSIASNPKEKERFTILVRKVGSLTNKLFKARLNDQIGIRGPLGNGFDLNKLIDRDISFISGGCGIAPMASLISTLGNTPKQYGKIKFFYGCKSPKELYLSDQYLKWKKFAKLNFIVEKPDDSWNGPKGLVTDLLTKEKFSWRDRAIICGPPVMIKFVIKELLKQGLASDNIYLSLERRMSCGVGVCQHCLIGTKYVCKDGPIFSLKDIRQEDPDIFK